MGSEDAKQEPRTDKVEDGFVDTSRNLGTEKVGVCSEDTKQEPRTEKVGEGSVDTNRNLGRIRLVRVQQIQTRT